ncbi:MAG: metallophosphoesterase family protein [Spirochaetota bacterium]
MKIIATADVHLGMKFSSYASRREELAEERFRALERVVAAGNERGADVLVVAGDLFHRVGVAARVVERAAGILDAFTGAAVLVLPGNHDYLAPEGDRLWTGFAEAAGDRTVVLDHPGSFDMSAYDLPLAVLAAPCDAQHGSSHRLGWATDFVRPERHAVLGVAHGSVDGLTLDAEGHYFPMEPRLLASLPADLWLVGHTHRHHDVRDARLVVPGTPEPDGFDCPVVGTAALVDLDAGGAGYAVEEVAVGRFRFVEAEVAVDDAAGESDEAELARRVRAIMPEGEVLVRLVVTGMLADRSFPRWNRVRERLLEEEGIFRVDDDGLRRVLRREDVDRRYAEGSFAHRLLSRLVDANDHEALAEALVLLEEVGP